MLKIKPSNKEQLIYFLINRISLGTYDKRFLNNIQTQNLLIQKPLTSNQANLLDKIVSRYSKQLGKLELSVQELLDLPWERKPIPSLPEYTEAYLSYNDDFITFRSPYKKDFISEFNKESVYAKWNNTEKCWTMPANTFTLKVINELVLKHYGKVNYCSELKNFIAEVELYKDYKYWNPTLVYANNTFLIKGITEPLCNAIKDITFDGSLKSLTLLSYYGVSIDDSVITQYSNYYDSESIDFAIASKLNLELGDETVVDKLIKIGADLIIFSSMTHSSEMYFNRLKELFLSKIRYIDMTHEIHASDYIANSKYPVLINSHLWINDNQPMPVAKVLYTVNSQPITLK